MSIALVNSAIENVNGNYTSKSITIPATSAGNTLVVVLGTWGDATTTLSDNKAGGSSTYLTNLSSMRSYYWTGFIQVFYLPNCAAGITQITANFTASIQSAIWVGEYSGIDASTPLDAADARPLDYSPTPTAQSITTTASGDLIFGAFSIDGADYVPSPLNGFSTRVNQQDNSGTQAFVVLEKIGSAAGTETPSMNGSYTVRAGSVSIAFKAATGPPPASAVIAEQNLPANHSGDITVNLTGTNTNWNSATTWTPSGVSGWSVASKVCNSATSYTVVLTPPSAATPPNGATGTLTLTEGVTGSVTATTTIGTPTLSLSVTSGVINGTQALTLTGTNTVWDSAPDRSGFGPLGGPFTVTGGTGASIGSVTIVSNTSATATLTKGSTAGTLTITDASTGATATFTVQASTATIAEQNLPANHNGNITVNLTGAGTNWTSSTTWTPSGVAGWSVASKTCNSTTSYTVVLTPPAAASPPSGATGTLTLTEGVTGTVTATTTVGTPTLSLSVTSGQVNGTQALTLTGTKTLWSSETAASLFTVSGGTGASIGSISVSSNTSATATLTKGSATGTLTITDASTGATATFSVTAAGITLVNSTVATGSGASLSQTITASQKCLLLQDTKWRSGRGSLHELDPHLRTLRRRSVPLPDRTRSSRAGSRSPPARLDALELPVGPDRQHRPLHGDTIAAAPPICSFTSGPLTRDNAPHACRKDTIN